jgi:hypothetical protein
MHAEHDSEDARPLNDRLKGTIVRAVRPKRAVNSKKTKLTTCGVKNDEADLFSFPTLSRAALACTYRLGQTSTTPAHIFCAHWHNSALSTVTVFWLHRFVCDSVTHRSRDSSSMLTEDCPTAQVSLCHRWGGRHVGRIEHLDRRPPSAPCKSVLVARASLAVQCCRVTHSHSRACGRGEGVQGGAQGRLGIPSLVGCCSQPLLPCRLAYRL